MANRVDCSSLKKFVMFCKEMNTGSENVEVLKVDRGTLKGVNLSTKPFEQMKNLRVFIINELHISGDFGLSSKKLKWLSWQNCPL
uniref:Uncharacterized protein LOC104245477 isoform X2 n=1 Tax=Nicotiana sylvestris TaxID=4096 RepID=A0A1U7YBR4_NICSY|nr:PREDICTED: uncharacterized protein LOC104245477 isoform X2 [Nicotiana sylvestris]